MGCRQVRRLFAKMEGGVPEVAKGKADQVDLKYIYYPPKELERVNSEVFITEIKKYGVDNGGRRSGRRSTRGSSLATSSSTSSQPPSGP